MRVLRYMVLAGMALAGAAHAGPRDAIPEAFQGKWSKSAATCASQPEDTYGVQVSGMAIEFYDGRATVTSVKILGADRIEVVADWSGEGRRWTATNRLSLSQSGRVLTITGYGGNGAIASVRCS